LGAGTLSYSVFVLYSLITPNVLRVESEEKVVVEAHGLSAPITVTIIVQDFPFKKNILYQVQTNLNPENGMMGTAIIKVPTKDIKKDSKQNQYVVVKATFPQQTLEKVVLVHFHSGYIFIQTDKTIYTPGSTGTCIQCSFLFPSSSLGTWKITAKYEDSPHQTFSAQFDVKEYGKNPTIIFSNRFPYLSYFLPIRISSRYLYGKKLDGHAFVLFGVKMDDEKRSIPQSLKRISIEDGDGEATLTRAMLQARFANLNELVGHSLYVSVTVLTESGSDMVEAERTGINIVTSPYQIHFTKTPKYFKPGMPFELMVYVTNPDGSPAPRVPVQAEGFQSAGSTQRDGTAKLIINMPGNKQQVPITVKTAHPNLPANRQASKSMVAEAYQSQGGSQNYLHLAVTASELKPGDNLPVNFHLKSNNPAVLNQIQYFTYIILNKGKIIHAGRQARLAGQNLVTMSLPITPDLIPSFRIVAYYQVGNSEIVADSVWLDIQDTCMGTLVVKGASNEDRRIHEPGTPMKLKLEGDHRAYVGLVAVDKGVYVLNKKHKITQSKIWDSVEKSDIGCTAGSGKNNLGVFTDAGLALETSSRISTTQRTDPECPQPAKRRRRSVQLIEYKAIKTADYQDRKLKKCCEDGMHENPMGHSCEKRVGYILDTDECKKTFLDCCNYIKTIRFQYHSEDQDRGNCDLDEDFMSDEDITSRSQFPESWLWQVEQLTERPNELGISSKTVSIFLKDSITTWEVLAVSLSETKGICVAHPYEITVMKDFFIDLRLPYSVVRNEQVEIRAILYNYREQTIKVRLELMHNPVICSASTSKAKYRQILDIKAKSSLAVPLVIVPLQLGSHDIEVKAAVWGSFVSDGVKKKLKVVPEGMRMSKTVKSVVLDPSAKGPGEGLSVCLSPQALALHFRIHAVLFPWPGNPVTIIVENSIDGANLKHLIVTPSGCGEQNMIGMTPPVIATVYLDSTEQWERIGVERRAEAIKLIMQGYTQQMVYKKPDFSYAAFKDRPASTWLTAYVVKVFAMAKKLVPIENQVICGAVKWLILEKQKPDGVFQEDAPVIHGEMVGGYKGAEPDVSLTAFVLIALEEAKEICKDQVNSLEGSISKAADYLAQRYQSLSRPYTMALASYALAMVGKLNTEKALMKASTGGNRWEERNARTFNIEGTSYALLALLKMKKYELAGPIVKWLREQNYYGGGYGSTQATIMVFQALAQYQIDVPQQKDMDLDISILLPRRASPINYKIINQNALVARTAETKWNEEITVKAEGTGQGTLTVMTIYNAKLPEDESQCKKFDLRVSVEEARGEGAMRSVYIKICIRFLGVVDATMSIIDVSMLTGFSPDVEDLKRLSQGVDRYISKFEIDKAPSDRGNLMIYLDKVSHREDECLQFKAHQYFEVGLIQPASVTVYDYYTIDDRCTKFYHPSKEGGLFNKICHGEVCRCAEESCFMQQKIEGPITLNKRMEEACQPGVDYVYKTRLVRSEEVGGSDYYTMKILDIIKAGTDENPQGKTRQFISHVKCRESLRLELNKDYLIWGLNTDLWPRKAELSYIIGKDTWIEKWPNEDECQEPDFQKLCQEFLEFSEAMTMFGCPT
uniref:Complement C3 n=1 Tax=Gopherus evgoodei TaxID=1825980 RepID=A0A8C4YUJ0_9SAUR